MNSILSTVLQDSGYSYRQVFRSKDFQQNLSSFIKNNKIDVLAYANANYKYTKEIDFYKAFHVVRDPRDIVVSGYFSHLHSHSTDHWPELMDHRLALSKVSKDDGLFLEMEFEKQFFEHMYNWNYNQKNVFECKMEDLVRSPYTIFPEIFNFMELLDTTDFTTKKKIVELLIILSNKLSRKYQKICSWKLKYNKIPVQRVLYSIFDQRFSKLTKGRKEGAENVKHHYRKGVAGDWKNHFNQEHCRYFKNEYNDLLLKLKYEQF